MNPKSILIFDPTTSPEIYQMFGEVWSGAILKAKLNGNELTVIPGKYLLAIWLLPLYQKIFLSE